MWGVGGAGYLRVGPVSSCSLIDVDGAPMLPSVPSCPPGSLCVQMCGLTMQHEKAEALRLGLWLRALELLSKFGYTARPKIPVQDFCEILF
jgi:hypothetical protein